MGKQQFILSGVGGQGIVSAGKMLAEAAAIYEQRQSLMECLYGAEARGTFTKSEVIIDDAQIFFPQIRDPDIVLALHQIAYDKYVSVLKPGATLIYDGDIITPGTSAASQRPFPFTSTAEKLNIVGSQNMIALGALAALTGAVGTEPLKELVREKFAGKPKVIENNIKAIDAGVAIAG